MPAALVDERPLGRVFFGFRALGFYFFFFFFGGGGGGKARFLVVCVCVCLFGLWCLFVLFVFREFSMLFAANR